MRIWQIISTPMPPQEGIATYSSNLSRELGARGHDVHIFTRSTAKRTERLDGATVHQVKAPVLFPIQANLYGRALTQHMRGLPKPDIIHLHSPLVPPVTGRCPVIVTIHTPIRSNVAAIQTSDMSSMLYKMQAPFSIRTESQVLKVASQITAVSGSVAEQLGAYGVDRSAIEVTYNGVDTTYFAPPTQPRENFVLYTGRLGWRKGVHDLIRAWAQVKAYGYSGTLALTGKGPFRESLESLVRELNLESSVKFLGVVPRDTLRSLLQRAEMFAFPSHYEGLPTSILEAMATATPIVTTDAPGVADLVEHRKTALQCRVGDVDAIAQSIIELTRNDSLRRDIGREARRTVEEKYTWPAIAARYEALYEDIRSR